MTINTATVPNRDQLIEELIRNWPTLVISGLVLLFLFGMFVYGVVLYCLRMRRMWKLRWLSGIYWGAALPAGICSLGLTLYFMDGKLPPGNFPATMRPVMIAVMVLAGLLALVLEAVKGLVYTGVGARLGRRLRQGSFPHLRGWFRDGRRRRSGSGAKSTRRFPWLFALAASAAVVGYSGLLFWLTGPRVSPFLKSFAPNVDAATLPFSVKLLTAWLVALLAIKEEVVFRLFLQGSFEWWLRRAKNGGLWAVTLSAGVWTLAHAGMVEPNWVKFAQILPIGILLGLMRRRWGLESTMLVHVLLNLGAVFLLEGVCKQ